MSQTGHWSQPVASIPSSTGSVTFYNPADYQTSVPGPTKTDQISTSASHSAFQNTNQGQFSSDGYNSWNWAGDWNKIPAKAKEPKKDSSNVINQPQPQQPQQTNNNAKYEWTQQWDPKTNQLVSHQVLTNASHTPTSTEHVTQTNTPSLPQNWQSGQQVTDQGHPAHTAFSSDPTTGQQWGQNEMYPSSVQPSDNWSQSNQQQWSMPGVSHPVPYSSQQSYDPNQQTGISAGQQWDPNQFQQQGQLQNLEQTQGGHDSNTNLIDPTQHHWEGNQHQAQWQDHSHNSTTSNSGQYQWYSNSGDVNQWPNYYPQSSVENSSNVTVANQSSSGNSKNVDSSSQSLSHNLAPGQTGASESLNWSHGSNFSTSSNLERSFNNSYASTVSASTNETAETTGTEDASELSYDEGPMRGFFNSDNCDQEETVGPKVTPTSVQPVKAEPALQLGNFLQAESNFHRTDSSISNCSLQTVNFSRTNSAIIESMADQLESVSLSEMQCNQLGNFCENSNSQITPDINSTEGKQNNGDVENKKVEFNSNHSATEGQVSSHDIVEPKPSGSDTSSPDERISPPSSDWEMVQPHISVASSAEHSRNSSMSNSLHFADVAGERLELSENSQIVSPPLNTPVTISNSSLDNTRKTSSTSVTRNGSSQSLTSLHSEGSLLLVSNQPLSVFNSSPSPVDITNAAVNERLPMSEQELDKHASIISKQSVNSLESTIPAVSNSENRMLNEKSVSSHSDREHVNRPRHDRVENILYKPTNTHSSPIVHSDASPFQPPVKLAGSDIVASTNAEKDKNASQSSMPTSRSSVLPSQVKRPSSSHGNRTVHNMSPATTLWENSELSPFVGNIILAPAAPTVLPVQSVAVTTTSHVTTTANSTPSTSVSLSSTTQTKSSVPGSTKNSDRPGASDKQSAEKSKKISADKKGKKRGSISESSNKSDDTNSLDGILDNDWPKNDSHDEYYRRSRSPDRSYSRNNRINSMNSEEKTDSRSRERNREYGDRHYYSNNRPYSRSDAEKEDYYYRNKDPRYYRDPYLERPVDDRYNRPHSRQENDDRMLRNVDRPRSRGEYDREYYSRDKEKDRYKDYYYDYRYRKPNYDDRDYYDYYSKYRKGYYDEPGYYDKRSHADYYGQNNLAFEDYERYSQISLSRGQSPGPGGIDHPDAGSRDYPQASRSSSRVGYDDYYNRGYYDYSGYYGYGYDYDQYYQDSGERSKGRMTPQKYTIPHIRASFGPSGQIITVLPNRPADGQPGVVQIQDINDLLKDNTASEEFRSHSGPLIRGETHKNEVLLFCQKKAKRCAENVNLVDRESVQLIWKLLELLIKQNGTIIGTDIADLLLEGHEPSTVEYKTRGMKISESSENLEENDEDDDKENSGLDVTSDRSIINKSKRDEFIDRFRYLLLYGMKKDALEWAMKSNLWGHALFLASKMDNRTHANVMTRFANSAIRMNDPLQTLYQLMSGRQPAATTCLSDEKWGDWRPHLAMILSNHSNRPDIDRKSITTLGDTLASRGFLHASHFCYLMAQVNFGTFAKKTSKIVLIGSSHNSSLEEFVTNEAIQCTEMYEYAMSLGNNTFVLPTFQCYKFLYACRLAEHGFAQEALHYCEVLSNNIQRSAAYYQGTFVKVLYDFADRLKHYDPQRMHESEEADDPLWLQQLQKISQGFEDGTIQPLSGTGTPMLYTTTATSSESGEIAQLTGTPAGDISTMQYQNQYGQTCDSYGNQLEYTQEYSQENLQQYGGQYATDQQQQYGDQQYNVDYSQYGYTDNSQMQTQDQSAYASQNIGYDQNALPENQSQDETAQEQTDQFAQQSTDFNQYSQSQYPQEQGEQQHQQPQHRGSLGSTASGGTTASDNAQDDLEHSHSSAGFDYFSASTQQKIIPPKSKFSDGPASASRIRTTSESSTGSVVRAPVKSKTQPPKKPNETKGWFGGWFNKLGMKAKNEMILPDDKNPAIVWDPVKKRWTNTDGDGIDEADAPPPPKDFELSAKPVVPPSQASVPQAQDSESLPPSTGNRFARPKMRGARNQYVDVFNHSSPATTNASQNVPSNLFNVLPPTNSTPQNIFMPGSSSTAENSSQENTRPKSASSKPTLASYLEPPSTSSDSAPQAEEVPVSAPAPNATPAMFNPTQFQPKQNTAQQSTGAGGRLSQRRVYPK